MFGTVAHMRSKPGQEQTVVELAKEWERERAPKIRGVIGNYIYQCEQHPGEYILVALFEDRATYMANAQDPEQDAWYRKLRAALESDPIWEDGEVVHTFMAQR